MLKLSAKIVVIVSLLIVVSSCVSYKKVPYMENDDTREQTIVTLPTKALENRTRFQTGDIINISVNSTMEPSLVADFNLMFQPSTSFTGQSEGANYSRGENNYLVDESGYIEFPVFGKLKVTSLTRDELKSNLQALIKDYLKIDPIVTVRLVNYQISVLGEVGSPGMHTVPKDNINILEALALAGDMTIYGERDNVRIMRQMPGGEMQVIRLNMNDPNIASSPYFYLQQNDVLYVQPNKTQAQNSGGMGAQTSFWLAITSFGMGIVGFILMLANL